MQIAQLYKEKNKTKQIDYVVFLGPEGSYSEEAAKSIFKEKTTEFIPANNIPDVISLAERHNNYIAILPIENSTNGLVPQSFNLLHNTQLLIQDEICLPIHHQLLSKETRLADIKSIVSHPQSLKQCTNWIKDNLPNAKQITALSNSQAAHIASKDRNIAAIASIRSSKIYGLNILCSNIEDQNNNTTRFLVMHHDDQETPSEHYNKISYIVSIDSMLELSKLLDINNITYKKIKSSDNYFLIDIRTYLDENFVKRIARLPKVKLIGQY